MPKRTRTFDASPAAQARRRAAAKRRRITSGQRGYVRTSGFYGRFANGGENKFFDTDIDAIIGTVSTTMEASNLNIIVQGNTESNRIGRKVVLRKISVKGVAVLPAGVAANTTSEVIKMYLICDKQTNGAAFAATDLWETDSIRSFRNLANTSRFQVIAQKTMTFNANAGSGRGSTDTLSYSEQAKPFTVNAKLDIPLEFDNSATTGAVTTQRSNSLWFVTQSLSGRAALTVTTGRVRFSDK